MIYPKISIVTPSYNQVLYLEETILSVIQQNYPNLEYIIIDGGSTDGSTDIIKKYAHHLTYWISEPDTSHANALNKGFARSTGEIMAWINSDDKYFPWSFNTIAEVYSQNPDVLWTVGAYSNIDENGILFTEGSRAISLVYKNIYSYLFNDLHIQQESVFWRRSLWLLAGGKLNEDIPLLIDTDLWCRFFLHTKLWHIPQPIGCFRISGFNRSFTNNAQVLIDINNANHFLRSNLPQTILDGLTLIEQYGQNLHHYYQEIGSVNKWIRKNPIFSILPYFIYDSFCNYLYNRTCRFRKVIEPQKPEHPTFNFFLLKKEQHIWVKKISKYEIPHLV